jgi:hypothetical protein
MYYYLLCLVGAVYPSVSGAVNRRGGETDLRALQTRALISVISIIPTIDGATEQEVLGRKLVRGTAVVPIGNLLKK